MRRKLFVGLLILNSLLAALLISSPAISQVIPRGIFDCCKTETTEEGGAYCCDACCWFTKECRSDEDCGGGEPN